MNFAENLLSLNKVMLYTAPADRNPVPYTIPENLHVVEMLTGGEVYFGSGSEKRTYHRGTIFWHVPGDMTIFDTSRSEPYRCIVFQFAAQTAERIAPRVSSWRGSHEAFEDFIRQVHSAFFFNANTPQQSKIVGAYCLSELLMHALSLKNLDGNIAWKDPAQAEAQKERLAAKRKDQTEQSANTNENTVPENEISEDEQDEGSAFSISM